MNEHVRLLAVFHIALGAIGGLGALIAVAVLGGIAGFIEVMANGDPEATIVAWLFAVLGFGVLFVNLVFAIPSIVSGIGLLTGKPWGPFLCLVASALNLINIPFGTAVGVYGLWVLLARSGPAGPPSNVAAAPRGA